MPRRTSRAPGQHTSSEWCAIVPGAPACRVRHWPLRALAWMKQQLLHAPVEELGNVEHVLRRAGDLVDPAELLQLLARFAEHAKHLAIERELVNAARKCV